MSQVRDEFDHVLNGLEMELNKDIRDEDILDQEILETPSWGQEAADIILKMAADRANYIEKFGDAVVNRAQEWQRLANDLAKSIRMTAEKEADAIRRETARMNVAGQRIEVALREFSPEQEKYNGRDRRTNKASGSDPSDSTRREPLQHPAQAPTDPGARARQGTAEGRVEGKFGPKAS